ncbi:MULTISPECIES: hypothetical protein [Peribacillus]|uniref:hypothetical protein n=1 Tax=Peribacillus TaxID=2675229 RepID=UPI001F4FA127|nr:hypothetical protein [Peribacillus frigoritolerans]MCK2017600.1 hypothetical protein [Peribacillus frigoritolerans]MED3757466.1 hypothetical protein [Peribacillus frigoritolerans]
MLLLLGTLSFLMHLQRSYDINHVSSNAAADHPGPRLLTWCCPFAIFKGRTSEIHHEFEKYHVQRRWNL